MKEKKMPNEILYSVKMPLKNEDEVIVLTEKVKIFHQQT